MDLCRFGNLTKLQVYGAIIMMEKDKLRTTALKICGLVLPGWERREEGVCALPPASVPREIVE